MIPDRALRRWCGLMVAIAMLLGHARPALAYLKFGFEANGREVTLKWTTTPVRYFVTNQGVSGVSATDFQAAVGAGLRDLAGGAERFDHVPVRGIHRESARRR